MCRVSLDDLSLPLSGAPVGDGGVPPSKEVLARGLQPPASLPSSSSPPPSVSFTWATGWYAKTFS